MSRGSMFVMACAAFGVALLFAPQSGEARPAYNGEFGKAYPKVVEANKDAKCNVCHVGTKKSDRNDYGVALTKLLEKNEKDVAKIGEALKKAEGLKAKDSDTETFGDRLKAGKLPSP